MRGCHWFAFCAAASLLAFVGVEAASATRNFRYNPCTQIRQFRPENKQRGDTFSVGVAYWPNASLKDWGDEYEGLHPCNYNDVEQMEGLQVAVYAVEIDTLTLLTSTRDDEEKIWNDAKALALGDDNPTDQTMVSMVLFSYKYRSQARYVRSTRVDLTDGTGFVISLAAVARFNKGNLEYLQWQDLGCKSADYCSGCINHQVLLPGDENPTVNATSCTELWQTCDADDGNDRCHLGLHLGFAGTDANSRVMVSSTQLQEITEFEVSSLYGKTQSAAERTG